MVIRPQSSCTCCSTDLPLRETRKETGDKVEELAKVAENQSMLLGREVRKQWRHVYNIEQFELFQKRLLIGLQSQPPGKGGEIKIRNTVAGVH